MGTERYDVIVIGAGQAGLATGHYLAEHGLRFVLVDSAEEVGAAWAARWDSLRLFTRANWTRLPGLDFPAPGRHFPSKDEMAGYLRAYAETFALPVLLGHRVGRLTRDDRGYRVGTSHGELHADAVVIATGPAMVPRVPEFATAIDPRITSVHASDYRNPGQLPPGPALVVGAGNSGAEIGLELAASRPTFVAGRDTGRIPIAVGAIAFRLMSRFLTVDTALGRKFAAGRGGGTPLVRTQRADLVRAGVELVPRVTGVVNGQPRLEDGRTLEVASVVWCTGYGQDYSWVELSGFPSDGPPPHHRGVAHDHRGLYFVGLPFQSSMASSLVGGVGRDARYVVEHLVASVRQDEEAATARTR
jgi:putative flavoprotein involved in K+ transport